MEWKTVKLGEVCEILDKRRIPLSSMERESRRGKFPYYGAQGIIDYIDDYIFDEELLLVAEDGANLETRNEDIAIIASGKYWVNNHAHVLKDNGKLHLRLLHYLLNHMDITPYITGSAQPKLNQANLIKIELSIPDIDTQRRIATILSSLDDKIENNNRINRNLEAQAQALFKSWFVDFEPWGGIMPDDWKEGTIGEMCTCYLGGTPSRAKSEYWNGDIPWINSGEVNRFRIIEGSEYITELGLKKSATKLLPKKTTVLAITGATLGQVSLLEIEACANQSVIGILENEKIPYEFIYPLIVNDIEKIILNQTGGAQQHINKDNVESHNIIIPTDEIMAKYKAIQAPLFETIANNCLESHRLAALRDTLLPKLMRGEISL